MNWDRIAGDWKQLTGKVKEKWGKLTDDDLTTIAGKRDQLLRPPPTEVRLRQRPGGKRTRRVLQGTQALSFPRPDVADTMEKGRAEPSVSHGRTRVGSGTIHENADGALGRTQACAISTTRERVTLIDHGVRIVNKLILILLAIFLPPVAVVLKRGFGKDLLINILLCFLILFPGMVHALWIVSK